MVDLYIKIFLAERQGAGSSHPECGIGEVLRVRKTLGVYQAKVFFETADGRAGRDRAGGTAGEGRGPMAAACNRRFDDPTAYRVKQMALDMAHSNTGGELPRAGWTCCLTRFCWCMISSMSPRRMLIADEVGWERPLKPGC